jgi:hypothetical protein
MATKPTRNEIQNMPAGREMDVAIGYHVMDLVAPPELYPDYSTDISEAWKVVEKLHDFDINRRHVFWLCSFKGKEPMQGDTAPLAICRAALLTVIT